MCVCANDCLHQILRPRARDHVRSANAPLLPPLGHNTVHPPPTRAGGVVEYKYVLLDHSGQHAVAWQGGNNSVLAVRAGDELVEVFDNW